MPVTEFDKLINIVLSNPDYPKGILDPIDFAPRYLLNRFLEYLSPDSNRYYSSLNPIFSMELEYSSDRQIELINVVFLRDGVMPLLKFFLLNPAPRDPGPLLIIDQDLSSLVPMAWRHKVLLRENYHNALTATGRESKKLFFISPIDLSTPMDLIEAELALIKTHLEKGDELLLFFSSASLRGREHSMDDKVWGYKILEKMMSAFFSENPLRVLDWKEYLSLDLSDVEYYFINPLQYFFTDSFLLHDASQRGARPLIARKSNLINYYKYEVSHYHGFLLHQEFENYCSYGIEDLKTLIFELSMSDKDKKVSPRTLNLASEEFKDWAQDVGRDLYVKKRQMPER
jgi:hypothetical protein